MKLSSPDFKSIEESCLKVGVVTSTHGLKGEVKVYPDVDSPRLFSKYKRLYLVTKKGAEELDVERVGFHKNMVILKLSGIDDINAAQAIRGAELMLEKERIGELSEGQYFETDLLGIRVFTEGGVELGVLSEIIHTGANDVYAVRDEEENERLIPAIKQCIKEVDIEEKRMVIAPMDGLLDLR